MSTEPNTLFRKKPVVIEAFQLPAAGADVPDAFHLWCERVGFVNFASGRDETLDIQTLEGTMTAQPGDWIIKGVKGEFYPCKPDIFEATYEVARTAPAPSTPSAAWRAAGEPDPHAGHYDGERAALCMGTLTDDELANGAFMNYDMPLNLQGIMAGTHHSPIAWMTAVKDRIRWLSRALERARAAQAPAVLIDFKQATDLLAMFGAEPNEITLQVGEGHSGPGMYASYTDMPEEGAIFLGVSDQEAMPDTVPQAPQAGTGEATTGLCYSLNEEDYTYDDLHEVLAALDDQGALVEGAVFYEGDANHPTPSSFFHIDHLFDEMGERAGDECGEWADDFPNVGTRERQELEAIINAWIDANVTVSFWTVTSSRKVEVTAEMIAEHKGLRPDAEPGPNTASAP
ncbi:hypothetical protein D3C86_1061180 [compost metagenome]